MFDDRSVKNEPGRPTDAVVIREKVPGHQKRQEKAYVSLQRDLTVRLNHLRTEAREVCESYLARVDGDVSTLVDFLDGSSEVRQPKDVKAGTMDHWKKVLDGLSLKPHKGRKKDIRRIEEAIRAMMESAFD